MIKLWNPFRREDGQQTETATVFQATLRGKVLPEANARLHAGIGGIRRLREQVVHSSLELLNGSATANGDGHATEGDGVFGVLAEVETHVGRLAGMIPDPATVAEPGRAAQQTEYLVQELSGLEHDLKLVGDAIGGHRSELYRVLRQVETTRENLWRKQSDRAVIPKEEAAQKQVQRQREKKRSVLDEQILNVGGRLQRQERHLQVLEGTELPHIPVPSNNGEAVRTVGEMMGAIQERLARLHPDHAAVEDPKKHFGTLFAEAEREVEERHRTAAKQQELGKMSEEKRQLQVNVEKAAAALGEAVSQTIAVYREAVEQARSHVLHQAGEKGHICGTEFAQAVKNAYDALLKDRGLAAFRAQVRAGNVFFSSLPDPFAEAMDCLEELKRVWEAKQAHLHHEIEKQNARYSDQAAAKKSNRIRSIPVQRGKPVKGKVQPEAHFVSPLLQGKYIDLLVEHQEAHQKLQMIHYGQRAERWSHPIQAWLRSRRKRAEANAEPQGRRKR